MALDFICIFVWDQLGPDEKRRPAPRLHIRTRRFSLRIPSMIEGFRRDARRNAMAGKETGSWRRQPTSIFLES